MTTTIKVSDYYGKPVFYSVMPPEIFDTLELAALKGEETASVNKHLFDKMIADYNNKITQQ